MAIPVFPRTKLPSESTWPMMPTGLASFGQSGRGHLRSTTQVGREWTEVYPLMNPTNLTVRAWLATVTSYYRSQRVFWADHRAMRTLLGAGGGTPLVNGAAQSGASIITDGWPANTTVLRAGDVIRFTGSPIVHDVTADVLSNGAGQATIAIEPPVYQSPADNAAIVYNSTAGRVKFRAYIAQLVVPRAAADELYGGVSITFREVPGADDAEEGSDDIAALHLALSGGASTLFLDRRYGLTTSGGFVDIWADALARGLSVVGTTTTRPPWNAGTQQIEFDDVDDYLETAAAEAALNLDPARTITIVGALRGSGLPRYLVSVGNKSPYTGGRRLLACREDAGNTDYAGFSYDGTTLGHPDSAVAQGDTIRAIVIGKDASTAVSIDVANAARVSATGAALAAGSNFLTIGKLLDGAGTVSAAWVKHIGFWPYRFSAADVTEFRAWAVTNHGAVAV